MVTWTVEDTPWQLLSLLMNRSYLNCLSSGRSAGEQRARQGPCSAFKLNSKSAINTMLWEHYTQFHHSQYRCLIHAICSQQMSSACGTWQMVASGFGLFISLMLLGTSSCQYVVAGALVHGTEIQTYCEQYLEILSSFC